MLELRKEIFADERDDNLREVGKPAQRGRKLGRARYHELVAPADALACLEPNRPESQQLSARIARILSCERGETGEHGVAYAGGEDVGPACGVPRIATDQRVNDCLGRCDWRRGDAAE